MFAEIWVLSMGRSKRSGRFLKKGEEARRAKCSAHITRLNKNSTHGHVTPDDEDVTDAQCDADCPSEGKDAAVNSILYWIQ